MTGPTIAIAGGNGFIGSEVVRRLGMSDYSVRASYRGDGPGWHIDDADCSWQAMELDDPATVRRFVRGASAVIHCAGYRPRRARNIQTAVASGVRQLRTLLDACLTEGVGRVVYISSASTVMDTKATGDELLDENSRYIPGTISNAYFEAKAAMESEIYRYIAAGLDIPIIIPTTVFGPRDARPTTGTFIEAVASGLLPAIPGGISINIVDIRDVSRGIVAALKRGRAGRRYILSGKDIEVAALTDMIAAACNGAAKRPSVPATALAPVARFGERLVESLGIRRAPPIMIPFEMASHYGPVSNHRATGELNFRSRALEKTIEDAVAWLVQIGYLSWTHEDHRRSTRLPRPWETLDHQSSIC